MKSTVGLLVFCLMIICLASSMSSMTVYEGEGVPQAAVFNESPIIRKVPSYFSPATGCHTALHQGRRKQQEDRAICAPLRGQGQQQCIISPKSLNQFLGLIESVPYKATLLHEHATISSRYILEKRYGKGGFGDIWLASDRNYSSCAGKKFILKRVKVERGPYVYLSGLREKYFGELLLNKNSHIVRYIESFQFSSGEVWLVFRHEGVSLSKLLYQRVASSVQPSKWWYWLKTTEAGQEQMRNVLWQLLAALKSVHDKNITHRDVKPENMVICLKDEDSGECLDTERDTTNYPIKMRIVDFGSALDAFTLKHLYGSNGPSRAEHTIGYTPPEVFLDANWYRELTSETVKSDMWSVGVVMLELILGSPDVFDISPLSHAVLNQQIEGWNESWKELALKVWAFMEMCIVIPRSYPRDARSSLYVRGSLAPALWKCSEESFADHIRSRDPLRIGFPNVYALRLVRQLLRGNPEDRLNVDEALKHPYFSLFKNLSTGAVHPADGKLGILLFISSFFFLGYVLFAMKYIEKEK